MKNNAYVIGVDYGTDSVRAVMVDARNGEEIASASFDYPRWKSGAFCNASLNQFRQHPLDYIEGLEHCVTACLEQAGPERSSQVRGLSVDTTGSTPVAVDENGTPLALLPAFANDPDAMFVLWKDHTGIEEAAEINAHAATIKPNYLQFVGGIYSSEWFWAKLLHLLRKNKKVREATYSWVEHCDWIPYLLTGVQDVHQMKRSVCAAGHKALWASAYGGLPPDSFFASLDPLLKGFTARLFTEAHAADQSAGKISADWAVRLGLPADTVIGVGAFDAHMGAVGGQIEPYHLSKVMGTSTCDMLVAPLKEVKDKLIKGICGQVPGSVIPGMMGMEAGQSAFGDAYAWFRNLLCWPLEQLLSSSAVIKPAQAKQLLDECRSKLIQQLSEQAARLDPEHSHEWSVDWFNGRRTPDANQELKAAIAGINLGSDAPKLFRAIAEGTCFGARSIVDRFTSEGIPVKGVIGLGGVARKSPFIMQMMADTLNRPIRIHRSEQTCALGAAMFAATACGIYSRVEDAMEAMGQGFDQTFHPEPKAAAGADKRYRQYIQLGQFMEKQTARTPMALPEKNLTA